jgi:heme-degrading monooxygenase HmoA
MQSNRTGQIAVIFTSVLSGTDASGYARAATAMEALAAKQFGYAGFVSARGDDGLGISISYWADDAAAKAWRDHPDHTAIRERGRAVWYSSYTIDVARVERGYGWQANA